MTKVKFSKTKDGDNYNYHILVQGHAEKSSVCAAITMVTYSTMQMIDREPEVTVLEYEQTPGTKAKMQIYFTSPIANERASTIYKFWVTAIQLLLDNHSENIAIME